MHCRFRNALVAGGVCDDLLAGVCRQIRTDEKRFNTLISKRRFRVEQCFGTMKRLFALQRARYFGLAKTHARMAMAAIGQNLLKAANKITLNPQTPAIA